MGKPENPAEYVRFQDGDLEIYLAHLVQHITTGQLTEGTPSGIQTSSKNQKGNSSFDVWRSSPNIIKYEAGNTIKSIQVFSLNGKLYITQKPNHSSGEFSLANCPAGIYLIRAQFGNNTVETKKIIQY